MKNSSILLRLAERRQRSTEIITVLAKYGLAENLRAEHVDLLERVLRGRLVLRDPAVAEMSAGERIREALTELGTAWIKLGQLLSLRSDVVGRTVAADLGQLESAVSAQAEGVPAETVEAELGAPLHELFRDFDPVPEASASVAQVHRDTLHDGTSVVVKVVHHGADVRAVEDLEIMTALAQLWEHNDPRAKQYRPVQIAHELATMVQDALDMRTELASMKALGHHLANYESVYVPEPFPALSSRRVLTMIRVQGRPLREVTDFEGAGWNVEDLAHTVVSLYFDMVFEHGMFHADPHSGNFLLLADGRLGILDFGDVGRFSPARREQLERMVLAMAIRDGEEFSRILLEVSDPDSSVDVNRARTDLSAWFDRHIDFGVGQLDLNSLIRSAMDLLHRHGLTLPADFTLLIKVLVQLQSLSNEVDVSLEPGQLLAPHAKRIVHARLDPRRLARQLASAGLRWRQLVATLPDDLSETLKSVRQGTVRVNFHVHDPDQLTDKIVDGMISAAALVSSAQLISRDTPPKVAGVSVPGALAVGIGAVTWGRMATRRRSRFSLLSAAQNVSRLRPQSGTADSHDDAD